MIIKQRSGGGLNTTQGDARYLLITNNLSDLNSSSSARTNLGLVSGGAGDIWVHRVGGTMTGVLQIDVPTATSRALILRSTDDSGVVPIFETRKADGVTSVITMQNVLPGGSATANFLNVTGKLPTSPSVVVNGVNIQITGAGSAAIVTRAVNIDYNAGYTGSSQTLGMRVSNASAGTSTSALAGNIAFSAVTSSTTTGINLGISSAAAGSSNHNLGISSSSFSTNGTNINTAILGRALNTGGVQIGGLFVLTSGTSITFESAALIADNGSTTSPIFLARDNGTRVFEILDAGLVNIKNVTLPGDSTTSNYLNITGTLPSTLTAGINGVSFVITGAGSSSQVVTSFVAQLIAGYTGSSNTCAIRALNSSAGTNTAYANGNNGINVAVTGGGSGHNIGVVATAAASTSVNVGMMGSATGAAASVTNIGVTGFGLNTNATAPIQIGGAFLLLGAYPTWESAALLVDNGSQASPIALFRDNGATVFSIVDGGHTTWGEAVNMVFGTTTGTKIGTATTQKLSLWNAAPDVQPTNAIAAAAFVANTSNIANDTATFGGYTIGQIVAALKRIGALA